VGVRVRVTMIVRVRVRAKMIVRAIVRVRATVRVRTEFEIAKLNYYIFNTGTKNRVHNNIKLRFSF
jgi:hypothetical protein